MKNRSEEPIPVTVLTGFLGSGKTTLLNRILTEEHGHRIAVIENEFGEIGIDNELVINADEEIFEMNNGCICCTVRGDLIRILGRLIKRRDQFDRILIETTGLADPGPVAQTFFVDDELASRFRLDGIVTLVDAGHVDLHLEDSDECIEQIAFADALILNKTDLLTESDRLDALEERLRKINSMAEIRRAVQANVPIASLLDLGGFNLDRAIALDPNFLDPEYPFEWGGITDLAAGTYRLIFQPGNDASIQAVILPGRDRPQLKEHQEAAVLLYSNDPEAIGGGASFAPAAALRQIHLSEEGPTEVLLKIPEGGPYAFFLEHFPAEFELEIQDTGTGEATTWREERAYIDDHEHDDTVGSVGLRLTGSLNPALLNRWIMNLLTTQGEDIFRMKGVLSLDGHDERFVFQGVHMLFDGEAQRPWKPGEERTNELIFIGRNLDRQALEEGLKQCLA